MSNDEGMTKSECRIESAVALRDSSIRACSVIRHSCFVIFFALVAAANALQAPSAKEILDSVRMLESRQEIDLDGQLRENDKVIPFHLSQTGPLIRYAFIDPDEVLELRLG